METRPQERPRKTAETGSARRPYAPPQLVTWGSIHDLTQGGALNTDDGDFTGTGGV